MCDGVSGTTFFKRFAPTRGARRQVGSSHLPVAGIQVASVGMSGAKLPRTGSAAPHEGLGQPAQVEGAGLHEGCVLDPVMEQTEAWPSCARCGARLGVEQTHILCSTRAIQSIGLMSPLHSFGL